MSLLKMNKKFSFKIIRQITTSSNKLNADKPQPVRLAYSSYESTRSDITKSPLIVMHGLMGSKKNWNSLCKTIHLKTIPPRKIISVDARNHGESPHSREHTYQHLAEDVAELLKQLNIDKAAVLGHSMGGQAMMYLTLKYPNLIEKAIYVDISPVTASPNIASMNKYFNAMRGVNINKSLNFTEGRKVANKQLESVIYDKTVRDFILTNLVKKDNGFDWRINIDALQKNFLHIAQFPNDDISKQQYRGPVLFIGGSKSDYISEEHMPGISKLFPMSKLEIVEDAGHWVHADKPIEVLKLITDFLNQ